jgi:hypothetical protein
LFAFLLLFAQAAGIPVPANQERQLLIRGFTERLMPVQADLLSPSVEDRKRGWLVYKRDRNFEVFPNSKPAPGEQADKITIIATAGETESQPFAIYALRPAAGVRAEVISNAGADLRVDDVLFHPVQYPVARTRGRDEVRGSGAKTFVRYPVFLRAPAAHDVPADSSSLYWVTAAIRENARAGSYKGAIRISDATGARYDLPVEIQVLPFRLTAEGVPRFGAFFSGTKMASGEWAMLKRYGLDAAQWFWNANRIEIKNDGGRVKLDFTAFDAAVNGIKAAGMRGPLVLSLGNSWLGHYEIALAQAFDLKLMKREVGGREVTLMDMTDPRWEKPYLEGLRQIFAHAKEAQWPPLALLINDEPTKHIMAYHPYRYHLIKKHFPDIPVYGVFFEPEKDPGPLLHSSDIVVANRDLDRMKDLAATFGKRFWTYNNLTADQSFGKNRMLYGQIPSYYGSEVMWFWCWNYYVGNAWDDFDREQSDADWVAVYPSVDGVEPVKTLAVEALREAIDDVRYLKTLEQRAPELIPEIRRRQKAIFDGIRLDERINSDAEFFITTRNDDVERLRSWAISELLKR